MPPRTYVGMYSQLLLLPISQLAPVVSFRLYSIPAAGPLYFLWLQSGAPSAFGCEAVNCKASKPTSDCDDTKRAVAHHPPGGPGLTANTTRLGDLRLCFPKL